MSSRTGRFIALSILTLCLTALSLLVTTYSVASAGLPETHEIATRQPFEILIKHLIKSIADNKMGLIAQASASRGAASRGIKIPGNMVLMVFRNDFAVRMLNASIPAGFEAPLRIYVTENEDGSATVSYRSPTAVFSPYRNSELDALAAELDPILKRIVNDAVKAQ